MAPTPETVAGPPEPRQRAPVGSRVLPSPYGQKIETVDKDGELSIPGVASPGGRWLRFFFGAINRESAGVEDEWIGRVSWPSHGDGGPGAAGAERIPGRRKSDPEGPVEGAAGALGTPSEPRSARSVIDWAARFLARWPMRPGTAALRPILLAHGFTVAQMVELVRTGLATAHSQRVVVGRKAHRLCPNMWPLAMLFVQRRHG